MAPPLAGSPRVNGHRDYIVKAILHGLTGPIDNKTYTDVMMPMGVNNDEWIAAVSSFMRRSFGNTGGFVTAADVARVRTATAGRTSMWTVPELIASLPAAVFTDGWKVSASHHADAANDALTLTTWNAGAPQQAGMWFQVELPKAQAITEIQFESPAPGGRAGAPGTGAAVTSGARRLPDLRDSRADTRSRSRQTERPGRLWPKGAGAAEAPSLRFRLRRRNSCGSA